MSERARHRHMFRALISSLPRLREILAPSSDNEYAHRVEYHYFPTTKRTRRVRLFHIGHYRSTTKVSFRCAFGGGLRRVLFT